MKELEKEFIPYEQALALKELGFVEPCFGYYSNGEFVHRSHTNNYMQRFRYAAPTYSQAFGWFREKYNFKSWIQVYENNTFIYEIIPHVLSHYKEGEIYVYSAHEEAELACLKKLIEILKNKKD